MLNRLAAALKRGITINAKLGRLSENVSNNRKNLISHSTVSSPFLLHSDPAMVLIAVRIARFDSVRQVEKFIGHWPKFFQLQHNAFLRATARSA